MRCCFVVTQPCSYWTLLPEYGPAWLSRYRDSLRAGRYGDRILLAGGGAEIFRTRPDRPWAPPRMDTESFPGVKRPGRGAENPPRSLRRDHERVGLYLYSPSGPQRPVIGRNLPFTTKICLGISQKSLIFMSVVYSSPIVLSRMLLHGMWSWWHRIALYILDMECGAVYSWKKLSALGLLSLSSRQNIVSVREPVEDSGTNRECGKDGRSNG